MSKKELQKAFNFSQSSRGQYIISQALTLAIEKLSEVEKSWREHSNIADMRYLLKYLYRQYPLCRKALDTACRNSLHVGYGDRTGIVPKL